jgi:16S rRNA (guanine527-N7)-methyltransferase
MNSTPNQPENAPEPENPEDIWKAKETAAEAEEEIKHPDTPVPSLDEMRAAMAWAFEAETIEGILLDKFAEHALMVLEANRTMNLTIILDPKEVAANHYLDSWRTTQLLPLFGRKVLDIGSGGGFPAIPMALAETDTKFIALDSRPKKAEFLKGCIEKLGIKNLESHWNRGEDYLVKNHVDIVVCRGLSSVRENVRLLRKVRQSLKDFVMLKGKSWSREMRAGEREAERLGFRFNTVWEHELPEEMGKRAFLVYRAPGGAGR